MATSFTLQSVRGPTFAVVLGTAAFFYAGTGVRAAEPWPAEVQAAYRIQFNGLEIGQFTFNSSVHNRTYAISANAGISALLGIVRWNGVTRVSGALAGDNPKPVPIGFSFDFQSSSKTGSVRMDFGNGGVKAIDLNPPMPDPPGTVPLQPGHIRGVLDPLSAVMAISRPRDGNPCNQRLPVFDGKVRFDLIFSSKGEAPIADAGQGGQAEMLRVCRVRIVPIAGHVENEKAEELRKTTGIEVAFRAIPSADLFIPHRITIPTFAGSAELIAQTVNIRTQREQIALVN